jgi:hypothetical protein
MGSIVAGGLIAADFPGNAALTSPWLMGVAEAVRGSIGDAYPEQAEEYGL